MDCDGRVLGMADLTADWYRINCHDHRRYCSTLFCLDVPIGTSHYDSLHHHAMHHRMVYHRFAD
jgi:hypothetical protein